MVEEKSLADRLDIDYVRRPSRLRPWRWRVTLGVFGLTILAWAVGHLWPGKRLYQAGPVSAPHAWFNEDCARCHDRPGRTGLRLFLGDEIRAVSDQACTSCHEGPAHNHKQATQPACATCHREHTRSTSLVRVANEHCTSCHRNLEANVLSGGSPSFHNCVTNFAHNHPEFGLWRSVGVKDTGTIRFNHAVHLVEEGVYTSTRAETGVGRMRRKLDCQSCHERDATGRYMQPIRYEKHCAGCHPLSVQLTGLPTDPDARRLAEAFANEPAPHQPPSVVRAVLRDRLLQRFASYGREKLGWQRLEGDAPLPPGQRRPPVVSKHQADWVHAQLVEVERVLFNLDGGCRYCHAYEEKRIEGLPQVKAARINERELPLVGVTSRWLPHSRFSHETHRTFDCLLCHEHTKSSKETSDALLPRVETCQQCHQPAANVRSDCVLCHTYHPGGAKHAYLGTLSRVDRTACPQAMIARLNDSKR
jgi:hypothetical protein